LFGPTGDAFDANALRVSIIVEIAVATDQYRTTFFHCPTGSSQIGGLNVARSTGPDMKAQRRCWSNGFSLSIWSRENQVDSLIQGSSRVPLARNARRLS
jgi:hypothetical protein